MGNSFLPDHHLTPLTVKCVIRTFRSVSNIQVIVESMPVLAPEDIQGYKGVRAEEYGGYYVTKIIIPKGALVHLGRFYQKNAENIGDATRNTQCRADEAKIIDGRGKTVTLKPMEFHNQETIRWTDCKGLEHNDDDVTYEAGLRFSLRMSDVNPGTKF